MANKKKMKKIAILQSNYIPWKGYFHILEKADHFVFLDSVQYTCCDWRNRNKIKTPSGTIWLTVPTNGTQSMKIDEVQIDSSKNWQERHLKSLQMSYGKCDYFHKYFELIKNILQTDWESISELNQFLIMEICKYLNIKTKFSNSTEYKLENGKNEKIISIVKQLGGTHYVTGPAAKSYIIPLLFEENGITLTYMDYSHYGEYKQPWGKFDHQVSILDLLFCEGPNSPKYIFGKIPAK
ncbi:MAG: WbqC family protein [Candidatus Cloacimonadota bacterium]|nr:WbqC family protein [Candidatus Cloacimonadota bacterium]